MYIYVFIYTERERETDRQIVRPTKKIEQAVFIVGYNRPTTTDKNYTGK